MKLKKLILELKAALGDASPTALLDVQVLAMEVLEVDRLFLLTRPEAEVPRKAEARLRSLVERRRKGEPVAYLTGKKEFMGLTFLVDRRVLIPRPDTEILVEVVLEDLKAVESPRILDLGTGSGAIAVSLAKFLPRAFVWAVDLSGDALAVARENAKAQGVAGRMAFLQGSLFEPFRKAFPGERLDAVVSNPPYIPAGDIDGLQTEVAGWEPRNALDGGADGLEFYRRIVGEAPGCLKPGGGLYLETGHDQARAVENMLELVKCPGPCYNDILRIKDLAGVERVVKARRTPDAIEKNL